MIRTILVTVLCAVVGVGLGYAQAYMGNMGGEERFLGSRLTLAERNNEMSREEIVSQAKEKGVPKLKVVGSPRFNFGTMMHGTEMSHSFVFRNEGEGPLLLEMGPSTCKCTVGELDSTVLQPGEETEVTLSWKALSVTTEFAQGATIRTNDPEQSEVKLGVEGLISQSLEVVPKSIQLGTMPESESVKKSFYVFTYLDEIAELTDMQWGHEETKDLVNIAWEEVGVDEVNIRGHQNANKAFRVDLEIAPGLPLGNFRSSILYSTNLSEGFENLSVPVAARVTGVLDLHGGRSFDAAHNLLDMGIIESSEGAEVSLLLFVQGDEKESIVPTIGRIRPTEALEASVGEPRKSDKRWIYPIQIRVPKGAPEVYYPARGPDSQGIVMIKTTGGNMERELKVQIRFKVTK